MAKKIPPAPAPAVPGAIPSAPPLANAATSLAAQAGQVLSPELQLTIAQALALNSTQKQKRKSKAHKNAMTMRSELWPDLDEGLLWRRNVNDGFTTIPRTLSLVSSIIDDLAKKETGKSLAAGKTYFGLWCRVWDENLLIIENESAYAIEAGYPGERNTTTWRAHMRVLQKLGFIDVRDGVYGPFNYVLLFNPYLVLKRLKDQIPSKTYAYLTQRAIEIGAQADILSQPTEEKK